MGRSERNQDRCFAMSPYHPAGRPQPPRPARSERGVPIIRGRYKSGGDRATCGLGATPKCARRHGRQQLSRVFDGTGLGQAAAAVSVPGGTDGGPEPHEANTSAKASSSRSGSANTTAQNSWSIAGTVPIAGPVQMAPMAGTIR